MNGVHIYATGGHEPATRFNAGAPIGQEHWVNRGAHRLVMTSCCEEKRWAANCTVQVYYDAVYTWCRDGKGCQTDFWKRVRGEIL